MKPSTSGSLFRASIFAKSSSSETVSGSFTKDETKRRERYELFQASNKESLKEKKASKKRG